MITISYYNHGRWMADCPKCGAPHATRGDETLICAACWPGLLAKKIVTDKFGAMVEAPHVEQMLETQQQAIEAGECWEVVYPPERAEIERILRPREIKYMNWMPGESLDDLRAENATHEVSV